MCRNIKTLFNFEPPATEHEIQTAALQFVRKVAGTQKPSRANHAVFTATVDEVAASITRLLAAMTTHAPTRNREIEAARARERAQRRFPKNQVTASFNPD